MRHIRSLLALALLLCSILILFYSTLHLETPYRSTGGSEFVLRHSTQQVHVSDAIISKQEMPCPAVRTVPVSSSLRNTISLNGAYWNRMLYLALKNMQEKHDVSVNCNWSHCKEIKHELLQVNVHDFNAYSALFQDFLQGMNCRSPPLLINQPNKCLSGTGNAKNQTFLLLAIKSTPGNFERRQAVRETWGREGLHHSELRVRILFLLGSSSLNDPDLSALLAFEARLYEDLLQWDFHESFFNLTLKMNAFIQWTLEHCSNVSYVFSGDDDVFVNTPMLVGYLQSLEPSKASRLYVGQIISTASPIRDPKNKYYIPLTFYNSPYPPYAGGGGLVISGALLEPLYLLSNVIPFFPIDDVYTGMCMMALGITPEQHKGFLTFDVREEDRENLCIYKDLMMIHQRSPQQVEKLWRGIHSPLLTC